MVSVKGTFLNDRTFSNHRAEFLIPNFTDNPVANGFIQKQLAWSNYFAVELESLVYPEDASETLPSARHS